MIDRGHALSVTKQAEAAGIARSTVYYLPRPASPADLALMRQLDELHLEFPFAGARMLRGLLAARGSRVGRRHVKMLMQRMRIEPLYRRPRTTKPEPGHKIHPYLSIGSQKGPRIGVQKGPQGPSFCSVQQRHPSVPAHATAEPARATAVKNGRFWRPPAGLVLEGREHDGMMRAPGGVLDVRRGV